MLWTFMFFNCLCVLSVSIFNAKSFNDLINTFHLRKRNLFYLHYLLLTFLFIFLQVFRTRHLFFVIKTSFLLFLFMIRFIEIRSGAIFSQIFTIFMFSSNGKFLIFRKIINADLSWLNTLNNFFLNFFNIRFLTSFNLYLMRCDKFHLVFVWFCIFLLSVNRIIVTAFIVFTFIVTQVRITLSTSLTYC